MKENVLKDKSFAFAVRVFKLAQYLCSEKNELIMSKQLLRSGTSIGALYREAEHAESKADFVHKLAIAQKECNETLYWLELLYETGYLSRNMQDSIYKDGVEVLKLLTAIIKTTKSKMRN
ncbi:four helix bundle protein [Prolixibacteraceae bacterium JC049]|nr:four helix bundle protein [Prolixibacteraceae bacterium JC049]